MRASYVLDDKHHRDNIAPVEIREIALALGLHHNEKLSSGHKLRFGKHGSIAIDCDKGSWFSFEEAEGGGPVELVQMVLRCDWKSARAWLSAQGYSQYDWTPGTPKPAPPTPPPAPTAPTIPEPSKRGLEIWHEAKPVRGTLAETYLNRRGLTLPHEMADTLRFHPACPWKKTRHPALIVLGTNILTGEPQCIQRTALTADGDKIDRMAMGSTTGAAAMLSPDETVETGLALCEGTEDGLALLQAGCFFPVWTTFGTSGLRTFPVLPGIEALTIYRDNDAAGGAAANECARRWAAEHRLVIVETPAGKDFNATLKGEAA